MCGKDGWLRGCGVLLVALCFGACALAGTQESAEVENLVPEEQVTVRGIMPFFKAAFLKCEIDRFGSLKIEDDGMKTFVRVDREKKLVTFFNLWHLKARFSETQKLRLLNKLNSDLIIVRFYMHNATTLVCDYQLPYENGIRPSSLVATYRLFARVIRGALLLHDPEDIIGEDGPGVAPTGPAPKQPQPLPTA